MGLFAARLFLIAGDEDGSLSSRGPLTLVDLTLMTSLFREETDRVYAMDHGHENGRISSKLWEVYGFLIQNIQGFVFVSLFSVRTYSHRLIQKIILKLQSECLRQFQNSTSTDGFKIFCYGNLFNRRLLKKKINSVSDYKLLACF